MARKTVIEKQGEWSEIEVKDYLVNNLVDENGKKVSIRKIFRDKYFMRMSGFWGTDRKGKMKSVSFGTISYWIEKLNITEMDLYNYHTKVTGIIKCPFSEFSRSKNRNYSSNARVRLEEKSKEVLIKVFNELAVKMEYTEKLYSFYPLNEVLSAYEILIMLRYNEDECKFSKDFMSFERKLK